VIERRTQLRVSGSTMLVIPLRARGCKMMLMFRGELMSGGVRLDAPGTIEGRVAEVVVDYRSVIHVRDVDTTEVADRAVVEKRPSVPVTALESNTAVAKSVVHAAIEADMRTPVAAMPEVDPTSPTPVARRPE
jgi:hypothetical protein